MEAIRLIMAALGCFGLLSLGSCAMLTMGTVAVVDEAVKLEQQKRAERKNSGADSSRFGSSARYESRSDYVPYEERTAMDKSDWKFGDPAVDPNKR